MTDETLLYEPRSVKFCALNGTGAYLWDRLATPRSAGELMDDLGAAYRLDNRSQVAQEVQGFLDEFVRLSFLAPDTASSSSDGPRETSRASETLLAYGPPRIRVMDESEVLTAFQITSAGISWWVM